MPSIYPVSNLEMPEQSRKILTGFSAKMGTVPNFIKTLAHSPAVLRFYLGQNEALASGKLEVPLREQIALLASGFNHCDYCASTHMLRASQYGLSAAELEANLSGLSSNAKTRAALTFAKEVLVKCGHVGDDVLYDVREAGYSDGEVIEIIAHVAMNIFSNYFNSVAGTVNDVQSVATSHKVDK